jgi:hypothetical protein
VRNTSVRRSSYASGGPQTACLGQTCHVYTYLRPARDIATCTYYTDIDPFTGEEVAVAKGWRDRKLQRALMPFFQPENDFLVREALLQAGRRDLIGSGCDRRIPAHPPKAAIEARRRRANEAAEGDPDHAMANPAKGEPVGERGWPNQGDRPGRRMSRRQDRIGVPQLRHWATPETPRIPTA